MKVLLSWLKDFVDIDVTVDVLAEKLVSVGFEIEEIINLSDSMRNVVVGRIEKIEKHKDAEKLVVCQLKVDDTDNLLQIVTGANNVFEGALVPVALHDSLLPTGAKIKKGKLRGVESNGMLCSGGELLITNADYPNAEVDGILILKDSEKIGDDMNNVLQNNDFVLDVAVTSNRPDCNSIYGIAREIAAVLNKKIKEPDLSYKVDKESIKGKLSVKTNEKYCPRYLAAMVKDIKVENSDKLISKRLKAVGIRSINNVVDITNYVLVELGQPMHAFDLKQIEGNVIDARLAKANEKITLLDEKEYELNENMLVIANKNKPMALAGIMGGLDSGISNSTKDIVFESARFLKENVRHTSKSLGISTDASARFEKGIDFQSQEIGLKRALHLISKYHVGKILDGTVDAFKGYDKEKVLNVKMADIKEILGISIDINDASLILNSLGFKTKIKKDVLEVIVPLFREDIYGVNDIAEELIRMYGYDNIHTTLLLNSTPTLGGRTNKQKRVKEVKEFLVENGCYETMTYSFTTPKFFDVLNLKESNDLRNVIELFNPLGQDLSVMRTTLAYSMLQTLSSNFRKGTRSARFFEVAKTYIPMSLPLTELPKEEYQLALGIYGEKEDFYKIKSLVTEVINKYNVKVEIKRSELEFMHPGVSIDIYLDNERIGYLGEVHPNVLKTLDMKEKLYIAEINIDRLEEKYKDTYKFEEISKFPQVERDIAIVVKEEITAKEILDTINQATKNKLSNVEIFDIFRSKEKIGDGLKSVAISLSFRALDKTFTDEEIQKRIDNVLNALNKNLGAKLR